MMKGVKVLDAKGIYYRQLNEIIREVASEYKNILVKNVNGQRYIGDGLKYKVNITIDGTPGNDMAMFMDGPRIEVMGNCQDGVANTMNSGEVIIHGSAGDVLGYGMRGGRVFIRDDVGYRTGIHMKEYKDKKPVIVVGGKAAAFLGEYMAGGVIILLGLNVRKGEDVVGNYCGTGMHGGVIYIRGNVQEHKLGKEVRVEEMTQEDTALVEKYIRMYCDYFDRSFDEISLGDFIKLIPYNKRPYGNIYCYL